NRSDHRVASLGARFTETVFRLERMTRVTDLDAVGIPNDLGWALSTVAPMHERIDDGLPDHANRNSRRVPALEFARGEMELSREIVQDRGLTPPNQADDRIPHIDGLETHLRILHPLGARNPDIIESDHWVESSQERAAPEEEDPGDGGDDLRTITYRAADTYQEVLV